jgi:hypothetical protein
MLQRLSSIVAGRKHRHGTPLAALEARGLIYRDFHHTNSTPSGYHAYKSGVEALADARAAGW